MQKIIGILSQTYYGDVRYDSVQSTGVGKNKSEESISTGSSQGLCVRILSDNKWHYLGFDTINDIHELNDYWDSIKWYLQGNRQFLGKEFENLIAKKLDGVKNRIAPQLANH